MTNKLNMLKKFAQRININFKQTKSERSASQSYGNYNHRIKRILNNVYPFNKITRNYTDKQKIK